MKGHQEQKLIKFTIHHELIGNHSFQITEKCHMSELRSHIAQSSPLCIFENFHFQSDSKHVYQYHQELSELFKGDTHLNVVFDPYDYYSSKHHENKVKEILGNPIHCAIVCSRESNWKNIEEETDFPAVQLENLFDAPFTSELMNCQQKKEGQFAGILNISGFNPVPTYRKHQGDLYYIHVRTFEEVDFHVTANPEGFFANLSTQGNFNPNPNPKYTPCVSLLDLLNQLSPKFKVKFQETVRKAKITQFQRIIFNYRPIIDNYVWLKDTNGWRRANTWKNDCYNRAKVFETPFPAVKDWSMMFQIYRSAPSETLLDKMNRQKLRYKTYQQLIDTALQGIINIFNGNIQPLNSTHKLNEQIFYHQYLLFYFVSNTPNNIISSKYTNRDIYNLSVVESLDFENIFLTNMIIVKYRGYKIVVKTVPNTLVNEDTHFQSIRDFFYSNQMHSDDQFLVSIKKIAKQLSLQSQNLYLDQTNKSSSLITHPELKGFLVKDNKKFIFDCSAFTPRDMNFSEGEEYGFLRPQLMKIFNIRQKCTIPYNTMLGSRHKLAINERVKLQEKKLNNVARFAKETMVSLFIDSFDEDMRKYLSDSRGVISNLHKHGLSSKYLGMIYQRAQEKKSHHVRIMIQRVILVKSAKNYFLRKLQEAPLHGQRHLLKVLLNSLFCQSEADVGIKQQTEDDQDGPNSKKNRKKKGKDNEIIFEISFKKTAEKTLKQEFIWQQLKSIALSKFKHNLNTKSELFKYQFSKTAILRDLCLCLGIQLQKKQYFSKETGQVFTQDNIICMVPQIKMALPQPKQLSQLIEEGDILANKYQLEEAFEKYNRALQYLFISFNGVHEKLALINKKIAAIYYKVGDFDTAIMSALSSCEIYESLLGPQHIQTIQTYFILGVYQFARKKFQAAEFYMLKAIYLAKFAYSECYPEILIMYLNVSTVYEVQKKYPDAIMSLYYALITSIRIFGERHVHTAIIYSALASLHYEIPDIEQCIKYQQKAVEILEGEYGVEDQRVAEAKNALEGYRNLQSSKKVRELHEKQQKNIGFPSSSKPNFKVPYYDFKQRPSDFFWKKNKKMRYFF